MAIVTDAGLVGAAKVLNGTDATPAFTYIASGSGSTAEAAAQTALVTENTTNGAARAAATCAYEATAKAKWSKLFNFTGAVTIREVGVFNASSAGTMLIRHVLSENKTYANGESVEVTILCTMARPA